ncbi:MAG: hypothetical protein GF419_10785, partial [Ignavibacteriales bacterium]|nr:hypothetical protein [Ignavibacteriales bacterium]
MANLTDETDFQRYRRREWLKNERYRETLVAAAFAAFALVFSVVYFVSLREFSVFRAHPELLWWTVGILGLMVLRGVGVRALVGRLLERDAPAPGWLRYANGAFEISAPTAVLAIYLLTLDSSVGLLSPALLLYFVFITLSTLELDPALCFFLGALAAAEFFAVSFFIGDVGFTADGATVYVGWQYFA